MAKGKQNRSRKPAPRRKTQRVNSEICYLRSYNQITSTAGGIISPIYLSTDPFTLSVQGFSQFAALYRSYRVLKIVVAYQPNLTGATNNVLIAGSPIIHGNIRKASTVPASYSDVQGDQSAALTPSNMPFVHKISALAPEEKLYVSTGVAPTNIFAIETYASGYAASTNYGSTLVTYKVQFKDRYF